MLKVDTKHTVAEYEEGRERRKRLAKWLRDHGVDPLSFETVSRLNELEAAAIRAITDSVEEAVEQKVAYNDELRAEMDILGQACSYLLYFVDPEELEVI